MLAPFHFPFWMTEKGPEEALDNIGPSHRRRLDDFLREYLTFGGYRAVALKENPQIRQRDLQEIYSLYVRRDIKDLGDIGDVAGYNRLVSLLSLQIGNLVKDQELALSSGPQEFYEPVSSCKGLYYSSRRVPFPEVQRYKRLCNPCMGYLTRPITSFPPAMLCKSLRAGVDFHPKCKNSVFINVPHLQDIGLKKGDSWCLQQQLQPRANCHAKRYQEKARYYSSEKPLNQS